MAPFPKTNKTQTVTVVSLVFWQGAPKFLIPNVWQFLIRSLQLDLKKNIKIKEEMGKKSLLMSAGSCQDLNVFFLMWCQEGQMFSPVLTAFLSEALCAFNMLDFNGAALLGEDNQTRIQNPTGLPSPICSGVCDLTKGRFQN